jgi:hypothetical protein
MDVGNQIHEERFVWDKAQGKHVPNTTTATNTKRLYLAGIPLSWLSSAMDGTHSATRCALLVWFMTKLKRHSTVTLSNIHNDKFHLDSRAKNRGLAELEQKGLVKVVRQPSHSPEVTLRGDYKI